jgi:hypothetical protein
MEVSPVSLIEGGGFEAHEWLKRNHALLPDFHPESDWIEQELECVRRLRIRNADDAFNDFKRYLRNRPKRRDTQHEAN